MSTKIYSGKISTSSNQIYLVEKNKIYNGKIATSTNELKNIKPEGIKIENGSKIYKGKIATSSNQIMCVSAGKVYKGRIESSSNQIAVIDGDRLSENEFAVIIYLLAQKNNLL